MSLGKIYLLGKHTCYIWKVLSPSSQVEKKSPILSQYVLRKCYICYLAILEERQDIILTNKCINQKPQKVTFPDQRRPPYNLMDAAMFSSLIFSFNSHFWSSLRISSQQILSQVFLATLVDFWQSGILPASTHNTFIVTCLYSNFTAWYTICILEFTVANIHVWLSCVSSRINPCSDKPGIEGDH